MAKPNIRTKKKVAKGLQHYGRSMDDWVLPTEKSKRFSGMAANSFLLGVLFDRNIKADRAWDAGEWINESMGDERDPAALWRTLATLEKKRIEGFLRYGYGGKAFHRNYKTFARQLPKVARIMLEKYQGDPRRIWNNQRNVVTVRSRLEELPGIGPALSRMAVLILARNYGLLGGKKAFSQLDIKPDIHVMRVFRRTGLVEDEKAYDDAVKIARMLTPDYPASLDAPAWTIGQAWCRPRRPKCDECAITNVCPKL